MNTSQQIKTIIVTPTTKGMLASISLLCVIATLASFRVHASPGHVDLSFDPGCGVDNTVWAIVITNLVTTKTAAIDGPVSPGNRSSVTASSIAVDVPAVSASRLDHSRIVQPLLRPDESQNMQALKDEIQRLKYGQESLRNELRQIRAALGTGNALASRSTPLFFSIDDAALVEGSDSAPLVVIEFSDCECPHCQTHFHETYFKIKEQYVDTGKIKYAVCDLPLSSLHPNASKAAEAARCAGDQGRHWEMRSLLLAGESPATATNLAVHAQTLGLDLVAFQECLESGEHSRAIAKGLEAAQRIGVQGTPSFAFGFLHSNLRQVRIDRIVKGAPDYSYFQQTIDQLLASPNR